MSMFSKCSKVLALSACLSSVAFAQSISDMSETAREKVQEIKSLHQEVNMLTVDAQQTDDTVLIQCVSSKQASITALKDISEGALQGVIQATSSDKAAYELRKIEVALPRVRQFSSEAQKCISGVSSQSEDGTVETQISVQISSSTGNNYSTESEPQVDGSESYSFDSSSTSVDSGADSINPPPETSPY